jgi:hypothetical protein
MKIKVNFITEGWNVELQIKHIAIMTDLDYRRIQYYTNYVEFFEHVLNSGIGFYRTYNLDDLRVFQIIEFLTNYRMKIKIVNTIINNIVKKNLLFKEVVIFSDMEVVERIEGGSYKNCLIICLSRIKKEGVESCISRS